MGRVFSDLETAKYGASGHPEAPFRVSRTYERLQAAGHKLELPNVQAKPEDVMRLHSPEHEANVLTGKWDDADTPKYPDIGRIALISLNGALSAAAAGEPAFSLMRPPGHHAGYGRVSGFCFFNNVALAAAKSGKRVLIVDVDVHHGDGTEELVHSRDEMLFISLHQSPLYPGSGLKSRDNCFNFPLPPGTGETAYLKKLEEALRIGLEFRPELLAVSAGFDTYKEDPLAGFKLDKSTYKRIGKMLADTNLPRFAVLEGGYAEDLPILVENFLDGFF